MADNVIDVRIKDRIDIESNWSSKNPTPLKGERCITEGTGKYKIGDGEKSWLDLPYYEAMTASDRSKFDGIASGANKTTVDSALSSTSTNPVQNKVVNSALAGKSNTNHTHDLSTMINTLSIGTATPNDDDYYVSQYAGGGTATTTYHRRPLKALFEYIKSKLHKVAISGSYNDLSNKPTIPTVGNGTVTIKQAGTSKGTFTMNQSGNTTIELTDNNSWRGIQDNLTSTSATDSLSANQGKLLNDRTYQMRSGNITEKTDFNTITSPGCYKVQMSAWGSADTYHSPNSYNKDLYSFGLLTVDRGLSDAENRIVQVYFPHKCNNDSSSTILTRMYNAIDWQAWQPITKGSVTWGNLLNKPSFATVATSGSYNDLSNKPTIGNGTITVTQNGSTKGTFTLNQTGNATIALTDNNTWRGVQDNLTSTATDQSLSAAQGKWLNENKAAMMTLTNQNLNSVTTPGFYNAGGGNTVSNKPSGVDNFGLIVSHTANGTYYTQILFTTGSTTINKSYRRFCQDGTWGNWTEEKLTDTVYTHPSYTAKTNGLYKVTVDSTGHVSGTTAVAKSDITALGIPSTNTTYSTGTASTSGLTKLYTGTGTATDGTMTQAAIKSALAGKSDTGHTHVSLDKIGSVAYIGSDKANTAGWYKVYSTTLTGYSNHVARLLFTYGYANIGSAILDLHIRCDNATTIYVRELKWESRTGTAFLPGDAIINTNGNTWTLYIYNHQNQYGRIKVRVLESTDTSNNWNMEIKSNETPESATPTATITSSDGGSVNYANSAGAVAWGNVTGKPSTFTPSSHTHDDRYYTESEVDSKLSGKANSSHNHTISQITDIANASVKSATSATTAASAQSVEWNNVKNKPSTYTPSTHNHDNSTITSVDASKITTGTIDIARLPQGALERCVIVADDTARFKLTTASVQKGDTVKVTGTGKMYFVIDDTKLSSEDGYTVYTAGSATSAPWSGITGKPATYPPSSHNHDSSYVKLDTGGALNSNAIISWKDTGNWNNENNGVTFPVAYGGLQWLGQSDGIKLFAEETANDNLELVLQFIDDNSNGLTFRDAKGATISRIDAYGNFTGKANIAGTADIANGVKLSGSGTADAARHVWYSDLETETNRVASDNFKYNPVSQMLTTNISGNAATANNLSGEETVLSNGVEASEITTKSNENHLFNPGELNSIRTAIDFRWYASHWQIGNIRSSNENSHGFGFAFTNGAKDSKIELKSYIDTNGIYHGKATSATVADSANSVTWANVSGKPSTFTPATHNHDSTYLKLSGGTMTGALNFKNATWNAVGNDVAIGDHDKSGSLGIKGLNGTPKATFVKSDGTNLCDIGSSTAGKLETSATSFQLGGGATITYNSSTKSIDFTFN